MKGMSMDKQTNRLLRDVFSARPETHIDRLRAGYVREYPLELTPADHERIAAQMNRHRQTVVEVVVRTGAAQ
jgi:hypothetical protein